MILKNMDAQYIMWNARLDEAQVGIKIARRNINNLIYGRKRRRTKEPLDESERGEWKSWLKAQHSENEDHGIQSHRFMANRWGKQWLTLFFWAPKSLQMVIAAMKFKDAYSLEGSYGQPRQHIRKQRHYFVNKGPSSQGYGFPSDHVWMWELDYKESWVLENWCFWTVVLEKTFESPLDCKEIQPVHPEGDQSWIFIGMTDVEAETPVFWPPDANSRLIRKASDAGKDWRQEEKGKTEDEMVKWHHWLDGHEFE